MSTKSDYTRNIQQQDRESLIAMWDALRTDGKVPGWDGGEALEFIILRAMQLDGADVEWPYTVKQGKQTIEQLDGAVSIDNIWFLVESKDHADRVDVAPIAKLRSQLLRRPASTMGIVFSMSGFTEAAVIVTMYTAPQSILLWSGDEFDAEIRTNSVVGALRHKFKVAMLHGDPYFDARTEFGQ